MFISRFPVRLIACMFCLVLLSWATTGCSPMEDPPETGLAEGAPSPEPVRISYVEWVCSTASTHIAQAALEEALDIPMEVLPVTTLAMWESVAAGDIDAMVSAWLPSLHSGYYETNRHLVEDLGPNMEDVSIGLAVPDYVPLDSIHAVKDHADEFGGRIIGIDPGAGIMHKTGMALKAYEMSGFNLISGSDATLTTTLGNAINQEEWIVVTAWTPHWKFARWNLKYLKDPLGVFGEGDNIHTIVRQGLSDERPDVHAFFDRFSLELGQLEEVMLWIEESGMSPGAAGRRWVEENRDVVKKWAGR